MDDSAAIWPALDYAQWRDTAQTLQLWTQIVGKLRLQSTPWVNHGWQVPLYVTARGLGTSPIPGGREYLEIEFDFIAHRLRARTSRGEERALALEPQSVADFYARVMAMLEELGMAVAINETPNEVPNTIRFAEDRVHAAYDAAAAHRFRRALLHPGGVPGLPDDVTREAYSHEVSSAGFWPGNDAYPRAAFYAYAYPEPKGFRERAMPKGAGFEPALGEFILPYDTLRAAADPEALLLEFLQASYEAAAELGHWDRAALECALGEPARVRKV